MLCENEIYIVRARSAYRVVALVIIRELVIDTMFPFTFMLSVMTDVLFYNVTRNVML